MIFRGKSKFQNPIRQNYKHVRAIRKLLDFLPADAIQSVVVFTGRVEFKTSMPAGLFRVPDFLAYLETCAAEAMSVNRVQFCGGCFETARVSISKETDVEHIQRLRRRYGDDA